VSAVCLTNLIVHGNCKQREDETSDEDEDEESDY